MRLLCPWLSVFLCFAYNCDIYSLVYVCFTYAYPLFSLRLSAMLIPGLFASRSESAIPMVIRSSMLCLYMGCPLLNLRLLYLWSSVSPCFACGWVVRFSLYLCYACVYLILCTMLVPRLFTPGFLSLSAVLMPVPGSSTSPFATCFLLFCL